MVVKFPRTFLLLATLLAASLLAIRAEEPTCDWTSSACNQGEDPALKEFTYDVGDGPKTTVVYVEPELNNFYRNADGSPSKKEYKRVKPAFNGLAGKFINMSNKHLDFYWESSEGGTAHLMRHYDPFSTGGTGTFPTHRFFLADPDEPTVKVHLWIVEEYPENLYVYDPYLVEGDPAATDANLDANLSNLERLQYDRWKKTLLYNEQYKAFTGRSYLANFGMNGPRKPSNHFMWRADYFGQEHWVATKETHFVSLPPNVGKIIQVGSKRVFEEDDPRILQEHRERDEETYEPLDYMNMTLKVLSCAPRVFEIKNFLSQKEVDHILDLAGGITLQESTTGDVGSNKSRRKTEERVERKTKVRTSRNSWMERENSPVIDAIYRRAADLTRIDESFLRARSDDEKPEWKNKKSISESLQLVHYDEKQEYTAHHDFGYSHINDTKQSARYATILFYLNDDMVGGETSFPRWVNGKSFHELKVKPEVGKAILFYDQLPDGNMDDFSQHAAKPILKGEKWLINLWIWDPDFKA